uniref:Ubs_31 putative toxin n=1 Tax=Unedogemmula bisaya TaxID=746885 RepID=A0A098LXY5_UNEBI
MPLMRFLAVFSISKFMGAVIGQDVMLPSKSGMLFHIRSAIKL